MQHFPLERCGTVERYVTPRATVPTRRIVAGFVGQSAHWRNVAWPAALVAGGSLVLAISNCVISTSLVPSP